MAVEDRALTITADASMPPERSVIGARYELLGLLGSGGMGNVYKARDRELDELVALKVLLPHLVSTAGALERFRREVKLARRVTHVNVARVFDISEHGGDRVITMELVDGESLGRCLDREGRLSLRRAVEVARAICAGVGAANAAGVVHRDLKPDNVLIEKKTGRVVVTDFGIARAAEGQRTVGVVGTPAYMAPEQIDERATIDQRADVYALGAVIYEMLVGEAAWRGETLWALAAARLIEPPPDPRAKRPEVPAALAEIVLHAMARDPAMRIPSMVELDRVLGALVLVEATSPLTPPPRPSPAAVVTTGTDKRVAVLPFTNNGLPADDYVADGITDDLIDALSVARGLRVRSRGAVMQFKSVTRDMREVGRELDVQVVVEGSLRRTASGFRITARLVSVLDGFQLWARRFDVPEAQLLVENDRIAAAVAEALSADLAAPVRAASSDAGAVDLYLRARHAYHRAFGGDPMEPVRLFEELVARVPDDPRALAGWVLASSSQYVWPSGHRERLLAASERAIALAPSLPDGHVALGSLQVFAGEPIAAAAAFRRALEIAPASMEVRQWVGAILSDCDDPDSLPYLESALALDPTLEITYIGLTGYLALHGQLERLRELLGRADEIGLLVSGRLWPRVYFWMGDVEGAKSYMESAPPAVLANPVSGAWLRALVYGERPQGPMMPPLPPGAETPRFLRCFLGEVQVEIATFLGDLPAALAALEQLDALGDYRTVWLERVPILAPLRDAAEAQPIRARFAERARAVAATLRAR